MILLSILNIARSDEGHSTFGLGMVGHGFWLHHGRLSYNLIALYFRQKALDSKQLNASDDD